MRTFYEISEKTVTQSRFIEAEVHRSCRKGLAAWLFEREKAVVGFREAPCHRAAQSEPIKGFQARLSETSAQSPVGTPALHEASRDSVRGRCASDKGIGPWTGIAI